VGNFKNALKNLNLAIRHANQIRKNNIYFALWLGVSVQAFYVIYGGAMVISGNESIGMFLATVSIFKGVGKGWSRIYNALLNMESAIPALSRITCLLNSETSDALHGSNIRMRILRAKALLHENVGNKESLDTVLHPDNMPIYVKDLHFEYTNSLGKTLNFGGIMELQQGHLATIIGPASQGKSTLLKFVGGSNLVSESQDVKVFVPPHLRTVFVPSGVLLFEGTLFDNLTFGSLTQADADRVRVEEICSRLGIAKLVHDMLHS